MTSVGFASAYSSAYVYSSVNGFPHLLRMRLNANNHRSSGATRTKLINSTYNTSVYSISGIRILTVLSDTGHPRGSWNARKYWKYREANNVVNNNNNNNNKVVHDKKYPSLNDLCVTPLTSQCPRSIIHLQASAVYYLRKLHAHTKTTLIFIWNNQSANHCPRFMKKANTIFN